MRCSMTQLPIFDEQTLDTQDEANDALRGCEGLFIATLISIPAWILIGLAIFWIVEAIKGG